ncbi:MAG TPA: Rne/Rng family ribonuclease [Syntrophorhabdus sp.]|jgi:ribonuclease G|nr:Rne/Rng family ribonuclease [Syntrophorhabdus sp.]MDI9557581.1 Rne/Rng family ribonuclease [Pseudomonadota bacterium]OPX95573.1 MAG: Ribonuclease G [Syntrophorhabdus sp. PtaB.Bin027]OQB76057.1 MAG: Ribonuclease G [Deltaproteobacteria bacterium ADurb.Bin135]HNQ46879.1 Rne/Rng family ribonuclease [Syntrophorhabdus sp.]
MASELIINVTFNETRIAFLENGVLVEFFIEKKNDNGMVGNIYKGKVVRIVPGMDAAFVDIGLEKSAFLYVGDIILDRMMYEEYEDSDYPIAINERIEGVLEEGQELIVQVSREPIGQKGTRVTSKITLPGRLLVLMPGTEHIGVSRRIEQEDERKKLASMLKEEICPKGYGLIARTASEGKTPEELRADLNFLKRIWESIQEKSKTVRAPSILHQDLGIIFRVIRDLHSHNLKKIIVDDASVYKKVGEFLKDYLPEQGCEVVCFDERDPIFEVFGIEVEIGKLLQKKIWLKSGGYIVLDYTEALTVIDVNTGRYLGRKDLEDTILRTNLEAVKEIAYQIRLRNIGGIIIVDFIDMERKESRETVFQTLMEALKKDRIKTFAYPISELGLVQITRKRTRHNIVNLLTEICPTCEGSGYIKSRYTVCYEVLRELRTFCRKEGGKKINVYLSPEVASLLYEEEKSSIEFIEHTYSTNVNIIANPEFSVDIFQVEGVR